MGQSTESGLLVGSGGVLVGKDVSSFGELVGNAVLSDGAFVGKEVASCGELVGNDVFSDGTLVGAVEVGLDVGIAVVGPCVGVFVSP